MTPRLPTSEVVASPPPTPELDSDTDTDTDSVSSTDSSPSESLSTTIIQEIQDGIYTCLVCTGDIDCDSKVWSCLHCYRVYDLVCIQDWAIRGLSTDSASKTWRCPACSSAHAKVPAAFTCWCGRVRNPQRDPLAPFSCGGPCRAPYASCVHACGSACHPGQHPVCGAVGPRLPCACGRSSAQWPCLITPYGGWHCDDPCQVEVCARGHKCPRPCHDGWCGPCDAPVVLVCYCGVPITIPCHELDPKPSYSRERGHFVGAAACAKISLVPYDCGHHSTEQPCAPRPETAPCPYDPKTVTHCPCGKTAVGALRKSCTDPIPECDQPCGRLLPCGHKCRAKCHAGACHCVDFVDRECACAHSVYLVPCSFEGPARCAHRCMAQLNCRRHTHRETCCAAEPVALARERQAKKRLRRGGLGLDIMDFEPEHICTRPCGRLRKCGRHYCDALCHAGPCPDCLESLSNDLVCPCGRTVVPAPVRCGTTVKCTFSCDRRAPCGHMPPPHPCHGDDKPCPKCTMPVARRCDCGRSTVKGVLCSQTRVSCGHICSAPKTCGHPCGAVCVKECVEGTHAPASECTVACGRLRSVCPHRCAQRCHAGECDAPCAAPVTVLCACGVRTAVVKCAASRDTPTRIGDRLDCDEACEKHARAQALRRAFADGEESDQFALPYAAETLATFARQRAWCSRHEAQLREFVSAAAAATEATPSPRKSVHFPPMSRPQRAFIHELALAFKLYSELQDREPNRSVFVMITPATELPLLTLAETGARNEKLRQQQLEKELQFEKADPTLYNAILIKDVFFGVSKDDIVVQVRDLVSDFRIEWISQSNFVLVTEDYGEIDQEKENKLYLLMKSMKKVLRDNLIAFDCRLALVDQKVSQVLRVESSVRAREEREEKRENAEEKMEENENEHENVESVEKIENAEEKIEPKTEDKIGSVEGIEEKKDQHELED